MLRRNAAQARELWLDTLPQKDELPDYTVSSRFQENMDKSLRQSRRAEKRKSFFRSFGRVAAILLLVSGVSFAGLMSVSATFREKVLRVVTGFYHEDTQYAYLGSEENAVLPELQLDALPEGFTVLSDEQFKELRRRIHCENEAGNYLDIDVDVFPAHSSQTHEIDTEYAQVSVLDIQGGEVTVISENGWHTLLWTEDGTVFTVESNIDLSELAPIVARITEKP